MEQTLTIYLDDSGNFIQYEKVAVFAGLCFLDNKSKNKFIRKFKSINNDIKCDYCGETKENCSAFCPEIKNSNIKKSHKRRIMNLIKKEYTFGTVIMNKNIKEYIWEDKHSRGRYEDYAQKRAIKELVVELIRQDKIDPNKNLRIIINSDQHATATDGRYNLGEGIKEELKYGTKNYVYGIEFTPVIFADLEVDVFYHDSQYCYGVQAADVMAGELRAKFLDDNYNYFETRKYFMSYMTSLLRLP